MTEQSAHAVLRARVNQFVRAPIERVYAAYVDPALMPKWTGVKAIINASGPLDRPGTTFVEVVYGPYRPRTEVLAAEPPLLHQMGGRAIRGIRWRRTARFSVKDDGTEIDVDTEVTFPRGLIGGLLRRSQEGGRMERETRQRFATFARLVEGADK